MVYKNVRLNGRFGRVKRKKRCILVSREFGGARLLVLNNNVRKLQRSPDPWSFPFVSLSFSGCHIEMGKEERNDLFSGHGGLLL